MTSIDGLRQFVDTEYDTQIRETKRLWQQPVPARVAEGEAIDNIGILHLTSAALLVRCQDILSKFRPPDQIVLSQADPRDEGSYSCRLEEDRGNELVLQAGYRVSFPSSLPRTGWVLDCDTVDVRYLLQDALTEFDSLAGRRDRLLGILQGRLRPRFDRHRERRAGQLAGWHVFIGDHMQKAPVFMGQHREEWVTRSVLKTRFHHTRGTMLDIAYRMNREINRFPSRRFYGGRLKPSAEAVKRRLKLTRRPWVYGEVLEPSQPEIFVEVAHTGRRMRSEEEAEPADIVVDTVERIQGQERDLVIVSLTTRDPAHAAGRADFFFQPNRLNVSITRPRVKRIVIGSPQQVRAEPK